MSIAEVDHKNEKLSRRNGTLYIDVVVEDNHSRFLLFPCFSLHSLIVNLYVSVLHQKHLVWQQNICGRLLEFVHKASRKACPHVWECQQREILA